MCSTRRWRTRRSSCSATRPPRRRRWRRRRTAGASTDAQAAAVNAAEVIGKQLARQEGASSPAATTIKAQTSQVRDRLHRRLIDIAQFKRDLKEFGGTLVVESSYHGQRVARTVIAPTAQQQAPVIADEAEGGRRHHGDPLHRRRDDEGAHGERNEAGVVPGVVLHRHRVPRPRAPRPSVPAGAGSARVRDLDRVAVGAARPDAAAAREVADGPQRPAQLVLG